jgi:hypothetical protein
VRAVVGDRDDGHVVEINFYYHTLHDSIDYA